MNVCNLKIFPTDLSHTYSYTYSITSNVLYKRGETDQINVFFKDLGQDFMVIM